MARLQIFSALLIASSTNALALERRSVTCLKVGATATASWTTDAGITCTWSGVVGSNFGLNSINDGDYSCNGRCGSGCTGSAVGNVYTQDCFSHDICSYFNNASGADGPSDPNCGSAYDAAVDDTLLGSLDGCSQTNPSNDAAAPTTSPICS
ncbi:hypothetical protein EJ03DRAFT_318498 [Teratosphaeria nubilosa]|uniref:DUF8213 domain-containing protein n=1 Tax=Teratosphaeria nubilosa TaxID=161662 RepID=A0A6G1KZS3_9PEZI|nr:hypothetical protein EJ03DRAFT_318498 [Teratosphaeria nubilosa]